MRLGDDGSDILFIELLLERGADPHVFLPFPAADVVAELDDAWRAFRRS